MPVSRTHKHPNYPNPPSVWYGLGLIVIQLVTIGLAWVRIPPQIPMFYSLPYGFARLAPKLLLFLIPGLSLLTWIIHIVLRKLPVQLSIYSHIQFWMMQLVLFLFSISLAHIVLIIL